MAWAKYGAEFADECAIVGLSDSAFRTHSEAIAFVYRLESAEPRVTMRFAKRLVPRFAGSADYELAAKELAAAGFWRDRGDEWEIVHHAAIVRDSIKAQRKARDRNREAQRRFRQKGAAADQGAGLPPDVTGDVSAYVSADPVQNRTGFPPGANYEAEDSR